MILALILSVCLQPDADQELDCIAIVSGDSVRRIWVMPEHTGDQINHAALKRLPGTWVPELGQIILKGRLRPRKIKLSQLKDYKELEAIDFSHSSIDDGSLGDIVKCITLREIVLDHTQVSDTGISRLQELPNLQKVSVFKSKVTEKGASESFRPERNIKVNWKSPGRIAVATDGYLQIDFDERPEPIDCDGAAPARFEVVGLGSPPAHRQGYSSDGNGS